MVRLNFLVQAGEFLAGLGTQCGVKVEQGFAEQNNRRVTHESAADRDTLALSTGVCAEFAVEKTVSGVDASGLSHVVVDFWATLALQGQAKDHVLGLAQMGCRA
jgi:hypothetical protein